MFYVNVSELTADTEDQKVFKIIAEAEEKHKKQIFMHTDL